MMLLLLNGLCTFVVSAYIWSSFMTWLMRDVMPQRKRSGFVAVRMELKPFMLAATLGQFLTDVAMAPEDSHWFGLAANLLGWLVYRNLPDDDDRWKKRRKKLTESVQQVGGRLQVVPVGGRS